MREQNRGTYWDQSEKWDSVCFRGVRGSSSQGWMRTYGGERVQTLMARVKRERQWSCDTRSVRLMEMITLGICFLFVCGEVERKQVPELNAQS